MNRFSELRDSGLLWYINRTALHPQGLALALHYDNDRGDGEPVGWSIIEADDGLWSFAEAEDHEGKEKWRKFLAKSNFSASFESDRDASR